MFVQAMPWFIIWLPLRQERHLDGIWPIMEGELPGDSHTPPADILSRDVALQLAMLSPMLGNLTSIRGWALGATDNEFANLFSVRLTDGAERRRLSGADETPGTWPMRGTIQLSISDAQGKTEHVRSRFAGTEQILDDPSFAAFRREAAWPHLSTYDARGRPESVPEKAVPHSAVYFCEGTAADSGLRIARAVFLPVGTPEGPYAYVGPQGVWLILLILQALAQFIEATGLSERRVRALTAALQGSETFRTRRSAICADEQWVCRLVAEDPPWAWCRVPARLPLLTIPMTPEADPGRWRRVFPVLVTLCNEHVITQNPWPRLAARDASAAWPTTAWNGSLIACRYMS
jgi:hypothetical protein